MKNRLNKNRLFFYASALFIILGFGSSFAQEKKPKDSKSFKQAMQLAEQKNHKEAIDIFKTIINNNHQHLDAIFNIGLCFLNTSNGADSALIYFNKGLSILNSQEKDQHLKKEFQLSIGKAYQILLKPEKAIVIYENLLDSIPNEDSILIQQLKQEVRACQNAQFFIQNPVSLTIENLGSNVNSMYDDHSPLITVSENELFFTSRRNWINMKLLSDGQYAEKIYSVPLSENNWESARLLHIFFKQNEHEAAASLSADGKEMILFRNDEEGKSLYITQHNGETWSAAEKLAYPINSEYQETHASISADKSTLFFTSDRPGGYGGIDIYMTKKNINGVWGEPKNLGANINSKFDEETPMIHYDGKTLYFSSEGHNSMGRLDVFYSQMNEDSTWSVPVNLGFPINTPDDDFFFVPTLNKSQAYYASSKFADNYGGSDIYQVKFDESIETNLAVVEGKIDDKYGDDPRDMRILVTRTKDDRLMGDYRPNPESGEYTLFLEVGFEYEILEENSKEETKTAYINISSEMSYKKQKKSIPFVEIAMDAPLKQVIDKEINNFADFAKEQLNPNEQTSSSTIATKTSSAIATLSNTDNTKPTNDKKISKDKRTSKTNNIRQQNNELTETAYTIQLLALKKKPLKDFSYFSNNGISNIKETKCSDGFTRYTYGKFDGYNTSVEIKKEIAKSGRFSDVWIRPVSDLKSLEIK